MSTEDEGEKGFLEKLSVGLNILKISFGIGLNNIEKTRLIILNLLGF